LECLGGWSDRALRGGGAPVPHVERETAISVIRGLAQMMFVGMVLALLLQGNLLVGVLILRAITFAVAVTASRRAQDIKGSLLISFYAIAAGSGVAIAVMFASGTLTSAIPVLVPVGGMIIANAMNACAQSAERFRADVTSHVGQTEAGFALRPDCGLCKPSPTPRYAEIARLGLDTGRNGRNDGVGRQSDLRGHLSVHYCRHDLGRVGYRRADCDVTCASARFLGSSAIDTLPRREPSGAGPSREELVEPIIGG
jgi:Uncharacterised protein family (UPF0014)